MSVHQPVAHNITRREIARSLLDLSRARQALLSVAQPAIAAVLALGALPSPRQMALGVIAATCGYLAVFSLNDVLDRSVDERALGEGKAEFDGFDLDTVFVRHPIAGGRVSLRMALLWVGGNAAVSAVVAYLLDPACLAFFGIAVSLEVLYCRLRSVTWLKTFVSGAMVGVGGLAGWVAVAPLSWRAAPVFAFLALWEIAGRNIPNDLSDVVADSRTGLRTVATVFGGRVAARAVLAGAAATVAAASLLPVPSWASSALVALSVWVVLMPALALVGRPVAEQASAYFNRASLLPALVLPVLIVLVELVS